MSKPLSAASKRFHTVRLEARRATLARTFSPAIMQSVWKQYVRDGMRKQEVLDLHEYLDFHRNRAGIFESLQTNIAEGFYAPSKSFPVRIEKKNGVTRTLVIPTPEDAVVLQCLVEALYLEVRKKQPSRNAFFSRSHGFVKPEMDFASDYIWFRRWVAFSRMRFQLATKFKFICVTDIANYFDNVDYRHLRTVLASISAFDEVILDLLFQVLDTISWRPDYLPSPARGIPQVDFDAPRLLSHVFLFEIDQFLKDSTNDEFVRWVDDITISAHTRAAGKRMLRDLDELLMTRGLRLNSGKTAILSAKEAKEFFWAKENGVLDRLKAQIGQSQSHKGQLGKSRQQLRKHFDRLLKGRRSGHWDKVVKRYVALFGQASDSYLLGYCSTLLEHHPELREVVWRYLAQLGPSVRAFKVVSSYLLSEHALDDASIFHAAHLLTIWMVDPKDPLVRRLRSLGKQLGSHSIVSRSPFYFLASLWLLGKYGLRPHIIQLIADHGPLWRGSGFLSRQVACLLPKLRKSPKAASIRKVIAQHQHSAAMSVLSSFEDIRTSTNPIPLDVRGYVLNGNHRTYYSLPRFLVCLAVLTSDSIDRQEKRKLRSDVLQVLADPLYHHVVTSIRV